MDKKSQKSLENYAEFLSRLQKSKIQTIHSNNFQATKKLEADTNKMMKRQKTLHRDKLLRFIVRMSIGSFIALCILILFVAIYRILKPEIQLISDDIIKHFIVGVFAEIFGVVAIIAKQVWND